MNEEALKDAYGLFVNTGYNGTQDEFYTLLSENAEAFADSYGLFKNSGYNGSEDEYKNLLGLKKKDIGQLASSPLEKTQESTTSSLVQQDSPTETPVKEFDYSGMFESPEPTQQDFQDQIDASIARRTGLDEMSFEPSSTNVVLDNPLLFNQDIEQSFIYEPEYGKYIDSVNDAESTVGQAKFKFLTDQGKEDFALQEKELVDKSKYLQSSLNNVDEYLKRSGKTPSYLSTTEGLKFQDIEYEAAQDLLSEELLRINNQLLDLRNSEENKNSTRDWNTYIYDSVKEQHPEEDESFVMERAMQMGINPFETRTDAITINGKNSTYEEASDFLLLNRDEYVDNPDVIQFSDKHDNDVVNSLRKLKETQISAGSAFGDFFQSIYNRGVGFSAGMMEFIAMNNPAMLDPRFRKIILEEGTPGATDLREYSKKYAEENIRKYKYGIVESFVNGEVGDGANQMANMLGSALFDIGLIYTTGGVGLGLSSASAGGEASLEAKEYNKNVRPENRLSAGDIYANMYSTTAIIATTELFTLGNIRASKELISDGITKLRTGITPIREIQPSRSIGDSFISGITKKPLGSIAYAAGGESGTETLQQVGQDFTKYFTGMYDVEGEDGELKELGLGEFIDERILSYDLLDVAVGSLLPGALPRATGHAVSHFANDFVKIQKDAQFTVEDVKTGQVKSMSRDEFVEYTGKEENIEKNKNGEEKWEAKNANQIKQRIDQLFTEYSSKENTEAREKMSQYDVELINLSKKLNVASKKANNDAEILNIVEQVSELQGKIVDLTSRFVGPSNQTISYLTRNGRFQKFLKSNGYKLNSKINSRLKANSTSVVSNKTTDKEITSDEQLRQIDAQLKRKIKKPNVVTKETKTEVLKDNNVVSEAEVEVNEFSSKKAARKAVRDYKLKKANKAFQDKGKRVSNVKNFDAASTSKMDKISQTEFDEKINNGDYHIISADLNELSETENSNRRNNLIARLNSDGVEFTETLASVDGKSQVQFIIKGQTDAKAIELGKLMTQKEIISGKRGVLGTDGSYRVFGGTETFEGKDANKGLTGGMSTFLNVDGKKVVLNHSSGQKKFAPTFDADNTQELSEYLSNFVGTETAKFLMPAVKFLNNIKGLKLKLYKDSEAVLRDLIQREYDKVNTTGRELKVEDIKIDLNPETDAVNVVMSKDLMDILESAGIADQVMSQITDVSSRGFFSSENGTMGINLDKVKPNTMFHELGHPIHEFLEEYDPQKFNDINKELKNKKRWSLGKDGIPKKQSYYDWASNLYGTLAERYAADAIKNGTNKGKTSDQLKDDYYYGEAFAEYLADVTAKKLKPSKARKFLDFITRNTTTKVREDLENLNLADLSNLDDMINNLSTAILTGDKIVYERGDVKVEFEVRESEYEKMSKMDVSDKNYRDGANGSLQNGSMVASGAINSTQQSNSGRSINRQQVDDDAISRTVDMSKVNVISPEEINGQEVFVSAIDKSIVANITSPTGVTHNMMGGLLYSLQDGAGIWAFTTKDAADSFLDNLRKRGVDKVVLMTQADTGILGNLNFNDYFMKELKNSIDKGFVTEKEVLDNINEKINLTGNKKILDRISKQDIAEQVSMPISSLQQYELMLSKIGTVNRNKFNKTFIQGNVKLLNKAKIPRFEDMLGYLNEPLISEAQNGDLVGAISIDLNSDVLRTKEGDLGHHPAYPFVVYGGELQVFDQFVDVRDAFPKFRIKEGEPELETKRKDFASRTMALTTQTAEVESARTKRYQIIGSEANMSFAMKKNYLTALDMEDIGSMPEYIKMVTGWEKGTDGRWRYEIADGDLLPEFKLVTSIIEDELTELLADDSELLKKYTNRKVRHNFTPLLESIPDDLTIKDIIEDPVLSAYPFVGDIKVRFRISNPTDKGIVLGSYNKDENTIFLNVVVQGQLLHDVGPEETFSTIKHEIQHAIQDIEGFPMGANTSWFTGLGTKALKDRINDLDNEFLSSQLEDILKPITASRKKDLTFLNKIKSLIDSGDILSYKKSYANPKNVLTTAHPVLDDDKEYLGGFSGVSIYEDFVKPILEDKGDLSLGPSLDLSLEYRRMRSEFNDRYDPRPFYESVYGEIEARAVEKRLGMDEKARALQSITDTMNELADKLKPQEAVILFRTEEQFENDKNQQEILRRKLEDARDRELFPKKRFQITEDSDTFENVIGRLGINQDDVTKWRKKNKKPSRVRVPSENIMKYANNEITFEEYTETLKKDYPYMFDTDDKIAKLSVPEFTSFELMAKALKKAQVAKGLVGFNKDIPEGTRVGSRLDINANGDFGVLSNSIHTGDSRGKIIGYGKFSLLTNVTFRTNPSTALGIGLGEINKSPFARMEGNWNNATEAEAQAIAEDMLDRFKQGENIVRVSMRPDMASYFFDTKTGLPLGKADRLVQIGGFILAENPELVDPSDRRFMAENSDYPTIKRYQAVEEDYTKVESGEFRSNVFEAILNSTDQPRQANQWIKLIGKFPGAQVELNYIDFDNLLNEYQSDNNLKSISRADVLRIASAHVTSPAIASVVKGTNDKYTYDDFSFEGTDLLFRGKYFGSVNDNDLDSEGEVYPNIKENDLIDAIISEEFAGKDTQGYYGIHILNETYDHEYGHTKWESMVLPGGDNYREVIVRDTNEKILFPSNIHWQHLDSSEGGGNNVLVHLRVDDRMVDGKKILFIQEIQSDWAQRASSKTKSGERRGFEKDNPPLTSEEYKELNNLHRIYRDTAYDARIKDSWVQEFRRKSGAYRLNELTDIVNQRVKFVTATDENTKSLAEQNNAKLTEDLINYQRYLQLQIKQAKNEDAVRDMPWGKTQHWLGLGFRKAIDMAMKEGYDGISLVNGEMSKKIEGHDDSRLAEFYNRIAPKELVKQLKRLDGGITTSTVSQSDLSAEISEGLLRRRRNAKELLTAEPGITLAPYGVSESDLIDYESRLPGFFESDGFVEKTITPFLYDEQGNFIKDEDLKSKETFFNFLSDLKKDYAKRTDKSNVAASIARVNMGLVEYYYYNVVQSPQVSELGSALRVDFTDQSKQTHDNSHGVSRFQLDDDQEFLGFSSPALDILFGIKKAALEADYNLGEYLTRKYNEKAGFKTKITGQVTTGDPLKIRASSFLFRPENTFGDPALTSLFVERHGKVAVAMDEAKRKAVIFQKAFSESKNEYTPKQLTDYLRGYTETLNEDGTVTVEPTSINDLNEDVTISLFGNQVDVNLRDLMQEMRDDIDNLSIQGLDTGAFEGGMEASVKENLGLYLHRSYKKHSAKEYDLSQELVNRSKSLIRKSIIERGTLDPVKDSDGIEQLVETIFSQVMGNAGNRTASNQTLSSSQVAIAKEIYKTRKDIVMEVRDIMGEIHDPIIAYMESINKLNRTINTHLMLDRMQKMGEGKFWSSEVVDGTIVSNGLSKTLDSKFGAFEGHYVSDEIYAVLNNVYQDMQHDGPMKALYALTLITKWSKTVGNFPTHLRNLIGNFAFVLQSGHLPINIDRMKNVVASIKVVVNNFRYQPESSKQEIYQFLQSKGIMSQDTEVGLINDLYEDLAKSDFDISMHKESKLNNMVSALKGIPRAINKLYQSEDEIFKIYGFLVEKARYQKAGLSESEAMNKAADIINNTYPNYSKVPNIVRKIGKFPFFGTFVSFQSESLRVSYNSALIAKEELSSDNPTIRKIGVERMSGVIANNIAMDAAYSALAVLGLSQFAGEDEEDESIYGTKMSENNPNRMFRLVVPHYNTSGNLSIQAKGFEDRKSFPGQLNNDAYVDFFDSSKIDGTGFQKNMMRIMLDELPKEGEATRFSQLFEEFIGPFLGADITVKALSDADDLYDELIRKGYSYTDAGMQVMNSLLDDLSPSMIKNATILAQEMFSGDENDILLDEEMKDETISGENAAIRLLGVTLQRVNINKALFFGAKKRYGFMQSSLEELGMSYKDLEDPKFIGIIGSDEALSSKAEDLMNFVTACKYYGDLHEQDIDAVLSAAGVSSYVKNYIKYNKEAFDNLN